MQPPRALFLLGFLACLTTPLQATAISVYISPPNVQASEVSGTTVETFDNLSTGNRTTNYVSAIGTYQLTGTDPFHISAPDQYGGAEDAAHPTTATNYMTFGAQSGDSNPITLALTGPESYFGFWWSAGDANNGLSFYSGSTLIARVSTADILTLLNKGVGQVTAIDGTKYNTSSYFGNPNQSGADSAGPFAFVDFVAVAGTFDKIIFDNSGQTSSGFESDSHTILAAAPVLSGDHVFVETDSPEPSTLLAAAIAIAAGWGARRFRSKARLLSHN
jgi:hypothetical protein